MAEGISQVLRWCCRSHRRALEVSRLKPKNRSLQTRRKAAFCMFWVYHCLLILHIIKYRYTVDPWPTQGVNPPMICSWSLYLQFISASNDSTNRESQCFTTETYLHRSGKWKWAVQNHAVQGSTLVLLDHKTVGISFPCQLTLKGCGPTV